MAAGIVSGSWKHSGGQRPVGRAFLGEMGQSRFPCRGSPEGRGRWSSRYSLTHQDEGSQCFKNIVVPGYNLNLQRSYKNKSSAGRTCYPVPRLVPLA